MEFLFLLLLVGVVVLFVQLGNARGRLEMLERRLDAVESPAALVVEHRAPAPPAAVPVPDFAWPEAPQPASPAPAAQSQEAAAETVVDAVPARETLGALFEKWVAGRLLIWVGGIALVLAAIFLIRYSIEIGLITPAARMTGAALFGLLCLAAGEYARRGRFLAEDPRIAQALVGAGIAILYASAYGAYILYGLLGSGAAAAAMIMVTAAALGLSLRHGPPTAVMGLVGGFLTPLLVGNPSASAVPLLAYLALLDIALFATAWRRGWTWLAAAGVLLSFAWTGYLVSRPPDDALAAGVFILLIAVAAAWLRPGQGRQLALIQPLILAAAEMALLVARTDLGPFAWGLFGALSAAAIALALLRPVYRLAPPAALALALLLLLAKAASGLDPHAAAAGIGITLLFGGGGLALALWRPQRLWSGLALGGLAGPLLILRLCRPELLALSLWGLLAAALALGPVVLIWRLRDRAGPEMPAEPVLLAAAATFALLGGAAAWDLLPGLWVPAGWLVLAFLLGLGARRLNDLALETIALLAVLIGVGRALAMLPELATVMFGGLIGMEITADGLPPPLRILQLLALPALLLIALRIALPPLTRGGRLALPIIAGAFLVAALYAWFKLAFSLQPGPDFVARAFLERTLIAQALFATGGLLALGILRPPRMTAELARSAGTVLTVAATARVLWFDLILFNPAATDQWVGPLPVLNLVLVEFLGAAAWLYAARRRAGPEVANLWLVAFLAALIGGVALLVRQGFHGAILNGGGTPTAEFYSYSLAGLLLAIVLIAAGMRLADKALRLAGLVLLTATICKVFLIDAAELKGVLRILSFLGLGLALIGIGRFYGPLLRAEARPDEPSAPAGS